MSVITPTSGTNGHRNGVKAGGNGKSHQTEKGYTYEEVEVIADFLRRQTRHVPTVGVICGSGLGGLADTIQDAQAFEYEDIPDFPVSTVTGHRGRLVFGVIGSKTCVCMQGRFHCYEGYPTWKVSLPVRVMKLLGVNTLIVTNAAGSLCEYDVGDVMIMKDHINFPGMMGHNPLTGPNEERRGFIMVFSDKFGPRFPAMSEAYDRDLRDLAKEQARRLDLDFIREGVYVMQAGPLFETVAECRMLRVMGADVTGMSTVPEVTIAKHAGMRVLGMSLVTNKCVMEYDAGREANHEEVLETGRMRAADLQRLVTAIIQNMD